MLQASSNYNPVIALGSDLIAYWDANRANLITQSGGPVSSWADIVAGYPAIQGTGSSRPIYSVTGFNGAPGVSFDGIDDTLISTAAGLLAAWPTGASELWALAGNTALPADTSVRTAAAFGGATSSSQVAVRRAVLSGSNRGQGSAGNGAASVASTEATIDLSTRHVLRTVGTSSNVAIEVDGVMSVPAAVTPATGAVRVLMGALSGGANFWQGPIAAVLITKPLSTTEANGLRSYLLSRRQL